MTAATQASPRPRGDKRQRTRAALVEAAMRLIAEKGYERTTLDEVAERAGMSRGAIYGNFKNRDDLFLAVAKAVWKPIIPPFHPGASFREQMRLTGAFAYRAARERRSQAVGAATFGLYLAQHEDMRRRVAEENAQIFRQVAQALSRAYPAQALPMPADRLVRATFALLNGLVSAHFTDPEGFTEEVFVAAFEALAGS